MHSERFSPLCFFTFRQYKLIFRCLSSNNKWKRRYYALAASRGDVQAMRRANGRKRSSLSFRLRRSSYLESPRQSNTPRVSPKSPYFHFAGVHLECVALQVSIYINQNFDVIVSPMRSLTGTLVWALQKFQTESTLTWAFGRERSRGYDFYFTRDFVQGDSIIPLSRQWGRVSPSCRTDIRTNFVTPRRHDGTGTCLL